MAHPVIEYVSRLQITQGRHAGNLFRVLPWQGKFIRGALAPGVAEAALSVARGNGKSTLVSGIALAALDGPLAVPRGETVAVAASFEQARIIFDAIMAAKGHVFRGDKDRWKIWDTAQQARIEDRETGARVRCIGSDPRRAHGLQPLLVLADEPAQWPESTGEKMRAALLTALGKIENSRFVALGTRPASAEHWFSKALAGGADYAQCHAAEDGDPPFQRPTWQKANPSISFMPDLLEAIRRESRAAKRDPSLLASFDAYRLNGGVSDVVQNTLLDANIWQAAEGDAGRDGPCAWGVDLGTSAAMSAIAAYWPNTGRLECVAAFPSQPDLLTRGLRDGVGSAYAEMARRHELILAGGQAVDVRELIAVALDRFGRPAVVSADRWREAELRDALDAARVPAAMFRARGQGYRDGGEDTRNFRKAVLDGRVTPVVSLLLRSAMAEARTMADPAGNEKLCKSTEGGRRKRARDDAAASAILAVSGGLTLEAWGPRPGVIRAIA